MLRFSPNPNSSPLIHWIESEDDAFRKAREQDRPVMLFLSAFWCRYCQRMDEAALSDRENMALLNAYFVALRHFMTTSGTSARPVVALAAATVFGVGYIPVAPGTFGSAAGLLLWSALPGTISDPCSPPRSALSRERRSNFESCAESP